MAHPLFSYEDLTAKARIRDAAFALIADRGVRGATVREIADRAEVSPALVLHHFGSKQGVIDEVSRWVLTLLRAATREPEGPGSPAQSHEHRSHAFEQLVHDVPGLGGYLRRMLLDGGSEGLEWFRSAVEATAADLVARERIGMARPSADPAATAAMLLILGLAPVLLRPQLEHTLGVDFTDERSASRWQRAQTELLTAALYRPEPT